MTPPRPFAAPEGQEVSFVELFFDLVFVFALTQVTGLVALGVTAAAVARATLVFWMVWWAWTQFTWALNPADTRGGLVRVATLAASAAAFVMAVGLGEAFGSGGLWFIIPYVAVRAIGIGIQLLVAAGDAEEWASVRRFAAASVAGIVIALAGGAMAPAARPWVWLAAAVVDVATVGVAGRRRRSEHGVGAPRCPVRRAARALRHHRARRVARRSRVGGGRAAAHARDDGGRGRGRRARVPALVVLLRVDKGSP